MPSLRTLPRDIAMFAKYHLKRRVYDYPAEEDGLGIVPLDLDVRAYARAIEGYAGRFDVEVLAEVERGELRAPIYLVRSRGRKSRRIVVLAGVHGNEHAGLLAIPELLDRVTDPEVELAIVTPVNPIGAAHRSRYNGDGYDINRDFVRFDTVEARAVRRAIELVAPHFVVALHEGPQDATFFFANTKVDPGLARALLEAIAAGGTELARMDYFGRRLMPPGYAPMSRTMWTLSLVWARTLGMKATSFYCEELGIPEITLESSWRVADRNARVRPHVDLVLALMRELAR